MSVKEILARCTIVSTGLLGGCGGLSVTFENPSYEYDCVPFIDGESMGTISTTSNGSYSVAPGPHTFNTEFRVLGSLVEVGTPATIDVQEDREFRCWVFHE